jgi:3-methyladenine DNA glycosylase AlkD
MDEYVYRAFAFDRKEKCVKLSDIVWEQDVIPGSEHNVVHKAQNWTLFGVKNT